MDENNCIPVDVPRDCPYRDPSFFDGIDLILTPPDKAENRGIENHFKNSRIGPFGLVADV